MGNWIENLLESTFSPKKKENKLYIMSNHLEGCSLPDLRSARVSWFTSRNLLDHFTPEEIVGSDSLQKFIDRCDGEVTDENRNYVSNLKEWYEDNFTKKEEKLNFMVYEDIGEVWAFGKLVYKNENMIEEEIKPPAILGIKNERLD